ncbi:class I SAM-dependent methyltransferase [Sporolactobacillus shoreae]|uniref:Class I SAM-dependent methyltransferase n=1 Tax=Sporolactobacillus shoreae TaxID=1465501 RepID=A0A4Z0GM70_9BACL|nr:class I SAM-dependent methyltransferase [Sporolactobacillus shoreae]TGA97343.1 class I SAM-dependent methyltransferase [Sporolactobacillus shoreae]
MKEFNYKAFYDRVGVENGWNFSKVVSLTEGKSVNLFSHVVEKAKGSEILLDIGTGGGEAALSISNSVLLLVGIDCSSGMIATAMTNLEKQKKENVRFLLMDATRLDFPDQFFDLVTCRHSDFSAKEVSRVLAQDGIFLTQQVSENDKSNIKEFFGRGQAYGIPQGTLRKKYIKALQSAGFSNIQTFESNVTEYYSRPEDLIFLLKHTPIVPDFGERKEDFKFLDAFIQTHTADKGIETNASRFMLVAHK